MVERQSSLFTLPSSNPMMGIYFLFLKFSNFFQKPFLRKKIYIRNQRSMPNRLIYKLKNRKIFRNQDDGLMISIFLDFCIFWPSPGLAKGRYSKTIFKQKNPYAI